MVFSQTESPGNVQDEMFNTLVSRLYSPANHHTTKVIRGAVIESPPGYIAA